MTNQEIMDKVNLWQSAGFVHPLTCGNDSQHQDLVPKEVSNKVVLVCSDCNYTQNWIPEEVLSNYVEEVRKTMRSGGIDI